MTEIKSHDLRENMADIVNRVMFKKERLILTRHGKPVCMLVPIDRIPTLQPASMPQIRLVAHPQQSQANETAA